MVPRSAANMPASDLMEVVRLLPSRKSADEQIILELNDLGVRFLSQLVQDEYGPTRAERAAALAELIGSVEQVVLTIDALSNVACAPTGSRPSLRIGEAVRLAKNGPKTGGSLGPEPAARGH